MKPVMIFTPRLFLLTLVLPLGLIFPGLAQGEPVRPPSAAKNAKPAARSHNEMQGIIPPMSERFADAEVDEVPDFQRHVTPLLGRLGCNGRSCHGSFQGQGGFQLSLFGYDFKADHAALLDENSGRVDVDDVAESLILAKPIDAELHEGGKRFDRNSWQYNVLARWIAAGAQAGSEPIQALDKLQILPAEIQFDADDQQTQLTAIAHWADGSREDVTALCRFSSNDDAVAAIDENGLVASGLQGDTHVVVSYDRAVVPVAITRRVQLSEPIAPPPPSDHPIDQLIAVKHAKLGITPAPLCSDSEFIRRASLDVTGTLPAAEEVRRFLASDDPHKRQQLIEDLLDAPGYAAWWATRMSDWTGNSEEQLNNALPVRGVASRLWYEWLRVRLDDNVPYDEIVAGIATASSRQDGESYLEYCASMTEACQPGNEDKFAARDDMPLFWARRNFQKPEERAIGFAYAFMGIRIECAQCHKHPFDQWSKNDFDEFAKLFQSIEARPNTVDQDARATRDKLLAEITDGKKLNNAELRNLIYRQAEKGKVVPFPELIYNNRNAQARQNRAAQQRRPGNRNPAPVPTGYVLGQTDPIQLDQDPRDELMRWLREPSNPYFSRAIVNRVWSNYFGVGIINPTDDMNLANPASNEPLLEYLATNFRDQGFNLHWLHREILSSDAYARSTQSNASNAHDRLNFSRHVPRRLPAEVIRDAVMLATQSTSENIKTRSTMSDMAIAADVSQRRNQRDFALQVFGQSQRASNCDCDRSDSPSLLQSIYLQNDLQMHQQLASKDGWVAQACATLGAAGPSRQNNPQQDQITRKADQMRLQTIARVKRHLALDAKMQSRQRESVATAYRSVRKRFANFGFQTPTLAELLANPDGWQLVQSDGNKPGQAKTNAAGESLAAVIQDAYLRTLSRTPDPEETQIAIEFVNASDSVADGLSAVMWALVNTKEFIISH